MNNALLARRTLMLLGILLGATLVTAVLSVDSVLSEKDYLPVIVPLALFVLTCIAIFFHLGALQAADLDRRFAGYARQVHDKLEIIVVGGSGMTNLQRKHILSVAILMVGNTYRKHALRGHIEVWGQDNMFNHDIRDLTHAEAIEARDTFERIMVEGGIL